MFEDSLLDVCASASKKPLTVALSLLLQIVAVAILAVTTLLYGEGLPRLRAAAAILAPPPPPAKPAAASPPVRVVRIQARQPQRMVEPPSIPKDVARIVEAPQPPGPMAAFIGIEGATGEAAGAAISSLISPPAPEVPPPPSPAEPPQELMRVSSQLQTAKLISQPKPVYSLLARQTRIQGTVRLEATISKEGMIENLTVLSGHPLLIPAALDAVRQWRYQPTVLNGEPVEVITNVEVNFTLGM